MVLSPRIPRPATCGRRLDNTRWQEFRFNHWSFDIAGWVITATAGSRRDSLGIVICAMASHAKVSNCFCRRYRVKNLDSIFFKLVASILYHVAVVAAAVLVGVGSGSLYSTRPSSSAEGEVRGGVIILILAWTYLAFLVGRALLSFKNFGEMRWVHELYSSISETH